MTNANKTRVAPLFGEGLTGALQWRLLVVWVVGLLTPTAVMAIPLWRTIAGVFDFSPHAAEIARRFDILAIEDLGVVLGRSAATVSGASTASMMLLTWALTPLLAGVTLTAAGAREPLGFVALLQGGVAWYFRMLRLLLVSLVPLGVLVGGLSGAAFALAKKHAEKALTQTSAESRSTWAMVLTLVVFVVVHATVEAARAQYLADPRLRSGWRAWARGVQQLFRQPVAVLALYVGPSFVGLVVAAVLLLVRIRVSAASFVGFLVGFVLVQLAVAAVGWGRASRLFALAALAGCGRATATHSEAGHAAATASA
jgi:hypothetical protein